jgi:hypothetical protein
LPRTEKFTVELKNRQKVRVRWTKNAWGSATMDHLELRGPMTSTGYLSDFLHHEKGVEANRDQVIEHARALAQREWDKNEEKYGKQLTMLGGEQ